MTFSPPNGVTFHTAQEVAVSDLCVLLQRVAVFLQGVQSSSASLCLYHDWWQHDGLHFARCALTFQDLFTMIETPHAILEATPDDHEVFVGVASEDAGWYLRFRAEWDSDDRSIVGSFAVTVPSERAPAFSTAVAALSQHRLIEESADKYYARVIV
jgi:hypothetical protein